MYLGIFGKSFGHINRFKLKKIISGQNAIRQGY